MSPDDIGALVTGRALIVLVLSYAVCPYAILWVVVRCWPKNDSRRRQYLADYADVEVWMRPFWVGDVGIRSILDGLNLRHGSRRDRRSARLVDLPVPKPLKPGAFWLGKRGAGASWPPICIVFSLPYVALWAAVGLDLSPTTTSNNWVVGGVVALCYGVGRAHITGLYWLEYRRRIWVRRRAEAWVQASPKEGTLSRPRD